MCNRLQQNINTMSYASIASRSSSDNQHSKKHNLDPPRNNSSRSPHFNKASSSPRTSADRPSQTSPHGSKQSYQNHFQGKSHQNSYKGNTADSSRSKRLHEVRVLLQNCQGQLVQITMRDGGVFEGVMKKMELQASVEHVDGITLRLARKINSSTPYSEPYENEKLFKFVEITHVKIKFGQIEKIGKHSESNASTDVPKFRTDTEISNSDSQSSRVLEKFTFSAGDSKLTVSLDEEINRTSSTSWDQYEVRDASELI